MTPRNVGRALGLLGLTIGVVSALHLEGCLHGCRSSRSGLQPAGSEQPRLRQLVGRSHEATSTQARGKTCPEELDCTNSLEILGPKGRNLKHPAMTSQPFRLRGGVDDSETETEEEVEAAGQKAGSTAAPAAEAATTKQDEEDEEQEQSGEQEDQEEGQGEEGEEEEEEKPPPTPDMIRKMNERLWEASIEGNEPMAAQAIAGGANVNAFCRGPDKWKNISVGEIAGADEQHCGINAHWMELNNYTALHLAAASGNAAIIDRLLEAGADKDVECLQRVHPFPTTLGVKTELFSCTRPIIYKCTPLRIARAAKCGRCFFTSYDKSVDKLKAAGALDRDFHFPLNVVILGMAFGLAYLGLNKWPFDWFSEWPFNWADYPDMAEYM